MKALTVLPGQADSVRLEDLPDPEPGAEDLLVRSVVLGVCGTDREIVQGLYGSAPEGSDRLIIGHESLGEVIYCPPGSGFAKGDLVVGIVRRPDPVPCASCGVGEWDMCRNGRYTEHGIKGLHGFGSDFFRIEPELAVRVDAGLGVAGVLLEPASVLAKAWEQIERIGRRVQAWEPHTVLVTGAGPVGLLAALLGVQRGLDVHVFDRATEGVKPSLARRLGAHYHGGSLGEVQLAPDIVLECTGASTLVAEVVNCTGPLGIVCLTGLSSGGRKIAVDLGRLNRTMVLENDVVFGSVNANRRHYEAAAQALAGADRDWLLQLLTRRVPWQSWPDALQKVKGDVKVLIEFMK